MALSLQRPNDSLSALSGVRKQRTPVLCKPSRFLAVMVFLSMWMALSSATSYAAISQRSVQVSLGSTALSYTITYYDQGTLNSAKCHHQNGETILADVNKNVKISGYTDNTCGGSGGSLIKYSTGKHDVLFTIQTGHTQAYKVNASTGIYS